MKKILSVLLLWALLFSCLTVSAFGEEEATEEPVTLHVEMSNYSFDAYVKSVKVNEGVLRMVCKPRESVKWDLGNKEPRAYALTDGGNTRYDIKVDGTYSNGRPPFNLKMIQIDYTCDYDREELPEQIFYETSPDSYELIWTRPDGEQAPAAPAN